MTTPRPRYWEKYSLNELSETEWEMLCDGCAKCCLIKLQDEGSHKLCYTRVACKLLDVETCRCRDYLNRHEQVPECLSIRPDREGVFTWLPDSCAYRLIHERKPLPPWHRLLSADPKSVHRSGHSVMGKVFSESNIHPDELEDHIVHWVN